MTAVLITTNLGNITAELDAEKAPKTVANFLDLRRQAGHYNNTIFHRVIDDFMIQGGGFEPGMKQKPADATVENEAKNGLKNDTYTLAMARTSDPHSASAQFFINIKNNSFLDYPGQDGWGYAVFGKVTEGKDVVDAIRTTSRPAAAACSPTCRSTPVIIEKSRSRSDNGMQRASAMQPCLRRDDACAPARAVHFRPAPAGLAPAHLRRRFFRFLERAARCMRKQLYLLGDLFEYWAGDDDVADPFHQTHHHGASAPSAMPAWRSSGSRATATSWSAPALPHAAGA